VGCYIWYSEEGPGRAAAPSRLLLAVPNVTSHSSTANAPTSLLLDVTVFVKDVDLEAMPTSIFFNDDDDDDLCTLNGSDVNRPIF